MDGSYFDKPTNGDQWDDNDTDTNGLIDNEVATCAYLCDQVNNINQFTQYVYVCIGGEWADGLMERSMCESIPNSVIQ